MQLGRPRTANRRSVISVLVGLAAIVGMLLAVGLATAQQGPTPTPKPSQTASPTSAKPKEVPTPTPEPTPEPKEEAAPPAPEQIATGTRIEADPVRVATGDSDCLNVRPQPGTTFAVEPNACVPNGTLLWLFGETKEADGESWQMAQGRGWVATRYTQPSPAPKLQAPFKTVTLWQMIAGTPSGARQDVEVVRVEVATGRILAKAVFQGYAGGLGSRNPQLSPSGDYIAFSSWKGDGEVATTVGRVADGTYVELPAEAIDWSRDNKLSLSARDGACSQVCPVSISVYDPVSGASTKLLGGASAYLVGWTADGKGLHIVEGRQLERLGLDGGVTQVADTGERSLWDAAASPDGRYLFAGATYQGALDLVDLRSGVRRELARAPQLPPVGRCGGNWSRVNGWLDANRFFYHETNSSSNENGITVVDIRNGQRRLHPYFNVQDAQSPAPGLISFSGWVWSEGISATVVFLLDTESGDAVPMFAGAGAVWSK